MTILHLRPHAARIPSCTSAFPSPHPPKKELTSPTGSLSIAISLDPPPRDPSDPSLPVVATPALFRMDDERPASRALMTSDSSSVRASFVLFFRRDHLRTWPPAFR